MARWAAAGALSPALRLGGLEIWVRPQAEVRILDSGPSSGAAVGRLYGVAEDAFADTLTDAHQAARLHTLDGAFCAVLWDRARGRLTLFRDISSTQFLFYRPLAQGGVAFADDLDHLVSSPGCDGQISRAGLHEYLRFLDVATPHTIYGDIRSPEPGVELVVGPDPDPRPAASAPARAPTRRPIAADLESAADRVEELLDAAVARRLAPEGPILAFLSGGVDSAVIAAVAARLAPGRVTALTVGFEETEFDETPVAADIARHLGLAHRILRRPLAAYRPVFDALTAAVAYPFADPAALPTLLAFKEARTIAPFALDGTGAEVCVGTLPARHTRIATQFGTLIPRPWRRPGAAALRRLGPLAGLAPLIDFDDPEELLIRWKGWTRRELGELCGTPAALEETRFYRAFRAFGAGRHFERYTALMATMPDDRIHEISRLTGLEVRFPFFDPELARFIGTLPLSMRHPEGEPKRILRHVLARHVPRPIWDRPKHGFDFPFAAFLALDDFALIRKHLAPERVARYGLVDSGVVADTLSRFRAGETALAFRVWGLVVLFAWLENHWRGLVAQTRP